MGGVDTAPEMERMTDMRVYADQAATTSLSKNSPGGDAALDDRKLRQPVRPI